MVYLKFISLILKVTLETNMCSFRKIVNFTVIQQLKTKNRIEQGYGN